MTDKNTPAFPCAKSEYNSSNQYGEPHQVGMTLRDYFAGQVISGWIGVYGPEDGRPPMNHSASIAYRMADAMMEARVK